EVADGVGERDDLGHARRSLHGLMVSPNAGGAAAPVTYRYGYATALAAACTASPQQNCERSSTGRATRNAICQSPPRKRWHTGTCMPLGGRGRGRSLVTEV